MDGRRRIIAGNWKMNGLTAALAELDAVIEGAGRVEERVELVVCPPYTLLDRAVARTRGSRVAIGAQDVHPAQAGAHTGDISAEMLADLGVHYAIVGHSERRADHGEDDALVRAKAGAACAAGLSAIVCVGETEAQRDEGATIEVVGRQLEGSVPDVDPAQLVIAYEPVWAIGTGRTPMPEEVAEVHGAIRLRVGDRIPILYGGSVKPGNAAELLRVSDVDGALVGGASLKATDFLAIALAAAP